MTIWLPLPIHGRVESYCQVGYYTTCSSTGDLNWYHLVLVLLMMEWDKKSKHLFFLSQFEKSSSAGGKCWNGKKLVLVGNEIRAHCTVANRHTVYYSSWTHATYSASKNSYFLQNKFATIHNLSLCSCMQHLAASRRCVVVVVGIKSLAG